MKTYCTCEVLLKYVRTETFVWVDVFLAWQIHMI